MADKPPTLPPQSEPFPGSQTPGWNDPPTLCNSPATNSRPRLNLNKRVAFPLQQGSGSSGAALAKPTAIVPPNQQTSSATAILPPLSMPPITQPIAVVHPMPNMNAPAPPPPAPLPLPAIAASTPSNAGVAEAPILDTGTNVHYVPAMPRQGAAAASSSSTSENASCSAVKHI